MTADPTRIHEPPNTKQIADARHAARQALAALRATDVALMAADTRAAVARANAALRDVADDLEVIERRVSGSR
jgi:hypothetical protein